MKKQVLAILVIVSFTTFSPFLNAQTAIYLNPNVPIERRVSDLLSRMTIEEKIAQLSHLHSKDIFDGQQLNDEKLTNKCGNISWGMVEGMPLRAENLKKAYSIIQTYAIERTRLGIPMFLVAESLHGAVQEGATIFPQNIAMGATFNPELSKLKAQAISHELQYMGINQVLAPCIDIVRELRWGRVEESFGEDPLLCGLFGENEVKGYLKNGVSPMLKHFGAHGNPMGGLNLASVECCQRDLLDIFLKPFERVIKNTSILAVMSSYNSWNHIPNSASHYLLTDILRDQWGFKGYVYSDWGAISMLKNFHYTAHTDSEAANQALKAGIDVEASSQCYQTLLPLLKNSKYDEGIIDQAVRRILYAKFAMGLFEDPFGKRFEKNLHSKESVQLAKRIADESIILLKNENDILPLDVNKLRSIAIVGPNADQVQFGDYSWTKDNKDGITPLEGIKQLVGSKVKINYAKGCDIASLDESGIHEAVQKTQVSDLAIVFVGSSSTILARHSDKPSTCGEGMDLNDLNLTGAQEKLLKSVYSVGKPVILVLVSGKPFVLSWAKEHLSAILVQWYGGEQAGNSIAEILFGKISPSGRLNFSFPQSTGHLPVYYNYLPTDKGYYHHPGSYENPGRDYVFSSPDALYSFGEGLTYTKFLYSNLQLSKDNYSKEDTIKLKIDVQNVGKRPGKEVVQFYVRDLVSSFVTPVKTLCDFKKIFLEPQEQKVVEMQIPISDLYIRDEYNNPFVEAGEFEIQIGSSSNKILLSQKVQVGKLKDLALMNVSPKEEHIQSTKLLKIHGYVRDLQGTPISDVVVTNANTNEHLTTTNKNGFYQIEIGNKETVLFRKTNYAPTREKVNDQKIHNIALEQNIE